jgi:hypothetical protein
MLTFNEATPLGFVGSATIFPGGVGFNLNRPHRSFTFQKTITGVFSALVVNFEGSVDGINWFQLGTDATTAAGATVCVDKPCRYVRANVTTFTGGTGVAVSVLPME